MSKLEMVKALNDSGPQLQIVQAVMTLETQTEALRSMLGSLPQAVAEQTAEALVPLAKLREEVIQVLTAYDQVTAAQRQTLEELTQKMSTSAAAAFEQKTAKLDKTISVLSRSLLGLTSSIDTMTQTAQNIETIPDQLKKSAQAMTTTANELNASARSTRPKVWKQALGLILASVIAAILVLTGQVASNRLLPPSAVQQNAAWADQVWRKATPEERALLNQIASRPVK